jgi:3-methylcrotonyl-CoA carboxylase alpha subunit
VRVRLRIGGRDRALEVTRLGPDRFRIDVDGAPIEVVATAGADGSIRFRGATAAGLAIGVAKGDARHLWVDGRTFRSEGGRGTRGAGGADAHDLKSPAPGVVAEVHAQAGAAVRRGETLVVLESMKMFFPVLAPRDGRVERVLCARGDTVDAGVLLVELADEDGRA